METTFRTAFGRSKEAVQPPADGPDKWALLDRLTTAADSFELSHRTLTVLKALLSFLPSRHIPAGPAGVVFASNARLSERLHGMPESTLRRHLAQLVRFGLIARHDSPNRKRFARNRGGTITLAFGFDLSPLVAQYEVINRTAEEMEARRESLLAQRDRVLVLRHALIRQAGPTVLTDEAGRLLRRKPEEALLNQLEISLREALEVCLETPLIDADQGDVEPSASVQMSASGGQNERHIQDSDKSYFDSEKKGTVIRNRNSRDKEDAMPTEKGKGVTLGEVLAICSEVRAYFPDNLGNWRDLVRVGDQIATMLGIDQPVLIEAKRNMGAESAAVTVLCLLEKAATIRSPGAYLRRLTQMARDGRFSLLPMLAALDNRRDCQLTI